MSFAPNFRQNTPLCSDKSFSLGLNANSCIYDGKSGCRELGKSVVTCERRLDLNATERRFRLIEILLYRRHETITNLAFELGVSSKTIQRDFLEINTMIPIHTKVGRYYGGIYLMEGFFLHKTYLNEDEMLLLMKVKEYILLHTPNEFTEKDIIVLERMIKKYSIPK